MAEVILLGEPMAMLVATTVGALEDVVSFTRALAGTEVNVCIGLTRLGHAATYITKLSTDPFGKYIYRALEKENIGREFITFDDEHQSGMVMKDKVETGDPTLQYYRKNSAAANITPADVEHVTFEGVKQVHITGIMPAISESAKAATYRLIQKAKKNGVYMSFDPNLRYQLWKDKEIMVRTINDLASHANMVLPGISEGKALTGSDDPDRIADFYQNMGVETVIVKLGSRGAYIREGKESLTVPGYRVEHVVDTVGAGDGFAVGVISGRLEGLSVRDAVDRGNAIGALQVMEIGDNEGLPTPEKLKKFMRENKK